MGFYRIIKMIFKDILFKIPKKYLVVIIIILTMFLIKTNVKAVSYDSEHYVQFKVGSSSNVWRICCDEDFTVKPDHRNSQYISTYSKATGDYTNCRMYKNGSDYYGKELGGAQIFGSLYSNNNPGSFTSKGEVTFYIINSNSGEQEVIYDTFTKPYITTSSSNIVKYDFDYLNINGGSMKRATIWGDSVFWLYVDYNGTRNYIDLVDYMTTNSSANTVTFSVPRSVLIENSSIVDGRNITFFLYYTYPNGDSSVASNWNVATYSLGTFTLTISSSEEEQINNDLTQQKLSNINNSINQTNESINNMNNNINNVVSQQEETNNFLNDTSVNSNDLDINSPDIENDEVVKEIDGTFTNLFNTFNGFLNNSDIQSFNFYIPDMRNGEILSTITIPSDLISSKLSSINLFFLQGVTLLDLVVSIWYVLFTFWFLFFGTKLITLLYSGLIMQSEGLEELTKEYTGISKNML